MAASFVLLCFGRLLARAWAGGDPEALETLIHYSWPGNVRELKNVVERAVILCRADRVGVDLLPAALATGVGTDSQRPFALVIVSGLFTRLLISIFLMPVLYALVARSGDRLQL